MPQSGAPTPQSIPEEHPQPLKNSLQPHLNLGSELYLSPKQGPQLPICDMGTRILDLIQVRWVSIQDV